MLKYNGKLMQYKLILLIFTLIFFVININKVYSKENNSLVIPINGCNDDIVQVAIHLNVDFTTKIDPLFYGTGTLFGAEFISYQKGTVITEYLTVKAIQLIDKNTKVKKIRFGAIPKHNIKFGIGSEIIILRFKILDQSSAYFVLSKFYFGNRIFGQNKILGQPIVYQCPDNIEKNFRFSCGYLYMKQNLAIRYLVPERKSIIFRKAYFLSSRKNISYYSKYRLK